MTIDHVSIIATGFQEYCERFRALHLQWRANIVPDIQLWQLFVYDPSGVMLELTFSATAERIEEPHIPLEHQYRPREIFFRTSQGERNLSCTPQERLSEADIHHAKSINRPPNVWSARSVDGISRSPHVRVSKRR